MMITEIPNKIVFEACDKIAERYSVKVDKWLVGDGKNVVFHVRVRIGNEIFRQQIKSENGKMLVSDVYNITRHIIKFITTQKETA